MVDFRIIWTLPIGAVGNSAYHTRGANWRSWKQRLPYTRSESAQLETAPTIHEEQIGAVGNSAYHTQSESVYRFLGLAHGKRKCKKECAFVPPLIPPQAGGE